MKNILLLIALIGLTLTATAQDKGDIEIGGNLGLSISNISEIDNENATDSKISFNVAASGEYYFSESWGIKAKLIYDQKGWGNGFEQIPTFDADGNVIDIETGTTDFALNYLTIPLLANWHFGRKDNWYINFGPYVGFLLSAKSTENGTDIKESLNSIDFGLALGIGLKIPLNDTTKIFFEYDIQSGFADIVNENQGDTIRNGRSSLNAGILFTLN